MDIKINVLKPFRHTRLHVSISYLMACEDNELL